MTPAALLAVVQAEGVTLRLDPPDTIAVRGPAQARTHWLPEIRAHKPALVAFLAEPRSLWEIVEPNGDAWTSSFCPPQTLAEVLAGYPPGTAAEPIEDGRQPPPGDGFVANIPVSDALAPVPTPPQAVQRAPVRCGDCTHWRADTIGSGLGFCLIDAPASKRPGSLWPNSTHRCRVWQGVQP